MNPVSLVAIDDNPQSLDLLAAALDGEDVTVECHDTPEAGLDAVLRSRPRIVLLDLMMPRMSGMDVLGRIVRFDPSIEVILITAHYTTESAVEAIRGGAADYLDKPVSIERLRERVRAIVGQIRRREDTQSTAGGAAGELFQFHGIVGRGPAMLDVFARVRRIAPHFRTALVTGPTGSGKELVCRALHDLSPAASGPFVVCNCAAIAETLMETELFGHAKGAFTGASQDRPGLFEYANNGTLLLDEIGEMALAAQAKLLRAVQNQEVQRVGSPAARKVNVRVVAATHRDLRAMASAGTFREDLFFRLGLIEVRLPPLRDRADDVPVLSRFFLDRYAALYGKPAATLSRRAETALMRHPWPGTVRELEGVLAYAAMMADSNVIEPADFPETFTASSPPPGQDPVLRMSLEQIQAYHARRVLAGAGGDKKLAMEILGVSRATLYRLLGADKPSAS